MGDADRRARLAGGHVAARRGRLASTCRRLIEPESDREDVGAVPIPEGGQDLDGRRARRLGRRQGPRAHPRAPLRLGRLRGHPLLRDRPRPRGLPAHRAHAAPARSAKMCSWSCRTRSTRCARRRRRRSAPTARRLLHPPARVSAATASWGSFPLPAPPTRRSRSGRGAATSARRRQARRAGKISSIRASAPTPTPARQGARPLHQLQLATIEASTHGYDEAILLNEAGYVCEGTGENIFVVRDGKVVTPPVSTACSRASPATRS